MTPSPACRDPARQPIRSASLAVLALGLALSHAIAAGTLSLRSGTADGGGGHSQGNRFAVEGTVGQPDTERLAGNRFSVANGFWPAPAAAQSDLLFRSCFED